MEKHIEGISHQMPITELKAILISKREGLEIALKLPAEHILNQLAHSVVEQIRRKCTLSLEIHMKEESAVYNPSTFSQDLKQSNFMQLAITLTDLYELCELASCTEVLLQEYSESKVSIVAKRIRSGSSRDLASLLEFSANFLWRELQILSRAADNYEGGSMDLFIAQSMRLAINEVETWWQSNDPKRLAETIKEFKIKKPQWESSYQRLLLVTEQAKLRDLLSANDWGQVVSSLLSAPYAMADAICMDVDERYQSELTEKNKITDLEEKLQAIDFDSYMLAIEETLTLTIEIGFSLRAINWISSTEKFLAAVSKKLNECMRIVEKYYFEETLELREDPFLQLNLPLFHKLFARDSSVSDIMAHIEKISLPYAKFNITKKLSVSLQEILITKYGDYLGFLRSLTALAGSLSSRIKPTGQLAHVITEFQGEMIYGRTLTLPKNHCNEFKNLVLRLIVKDLRATVTKYTEATARRQTGLNQSLMAIDQQYTQAMYKVDQICGSEHDARLTDYATKRFDEYDGYQGGPDTSGKFTASLLASADRLPGVMYWREIIVCSVFMFLLTFLKSEDECIDLQKVEGDVALLKKGFKRSLKYQVN